MIETTPEHLQQTLRRIADIESRLHALLPADVGPRKGSTSFAALVAQAPDRAPEAGASRMLPGHLESLIQQAAARYNLRPALLRAMVKQESGGNPRATSPKGAQGLMQLMPGTAAALGVTDPYDPEQNIMGGAHYLRQQLDRFGGDERLALAAYNAGPGAVLRYNNVPPYPETTQYVGAILADAARDE